MVRIFLFLLLCLIVFSSSVCSRYDSNTEEKSLSIAFYNIDNLYDDIDDTDHDDDDFTPAGQYQWTTKRYKQKLNNMEKVIAVLVDGKLPDVLGVCELESKKAFEDLLATGKLKDNYGIVHYDSPDERGIDVALAYSKKKVKVLSSEKVPVILTKDLNDKTRDQLYVKALILASNDTVHFYVCHFPSRREGAAESEINRIDAAKTCKNFINSHLNLQKDNLIIMGDFNDEPWDKSISSILGAQNISRNKAADLCNLMWDFKAQKRGTYKYKNEMNTLDQFIISHALNNDRQLEYQAKSVDIFDADWLQQKGKYKGYPWRTFGGNKWLNGYSDHYAVLMKLEWKK